MKDTFLLSQSLIGQLQEVFDGSPWYGDSLKDKLQVIRKEAKEPVDLNKVASYVQHLINWRQFVIKKLTGDAAFDIVLNTEADWANITIKQYKDWDQLLEELTHSQQQLISHIEKVSDEEMRSQIPGKNYGFEHMVHGLVQHEVYHTGQIAVHWKYR